MTKNDSSHLLTCCFYSHIEDTYKLHLKIYTDGSVLENKQAGAACVILALKAEKSFYLGKILIFLPLNYLQSYWRYNIYLVFKFSISSIILC